MKILLVGEYNRTHRNIKLGLEHLGHSAKVVGLTDGFKKVKVDIEIKNYFETGLLKKIRVALVKLFSFDILGTHLNYQIKSKKQELSNYDVIQFLNEAPFGCDRNNQKKIIDLLIGWNNKPFLLSCGTDFISVDYAMRKKFRYSILTPYLENKGTKKDFLAALSYLTPEHKILHDYIFNTIEGVISNDLDYHIPLIGHPKYLGMIPHAINTSQLDYRSPIINDKIVIFHGINSHNYIKKGNDIFDAALDLIALKYSNKVEIITTTDLPYAEYIERFDKCHILLDQVYAYDQGFNALEAMAKGKVVFTGAEQEWLDYFNLQADTVAINALPNADAVAKKLEWLIINPKKIIEISRNGRDFVEQHHDHINCAKSYLEKWNRDK
ncbi:glycosyltransferase [Winogradskyella bathintestinalis]|uniref:Glycosyltransferase n=1 Tax=Winogradskyella bathintestinalis TaxID=3035208 RepID=A0ABT7ZUA9_9FLAO|nr:glycosyltransferase [Winogradskyella bathintestinalis]MDN3492600.1 glycosyltransferase [Winogradskyella bathintestinalis]